MPRSTRRGVSVSESKRAFRVAVIGGGFAGHSAALLLGRYLIPTFLFDDGRRTRNAMSKAVHGYLGFEGSPPATLIRCAQKDIARYRSVSRISGRVKRVKKLRNGLFRVYYGAQRTLDVWSVVLATGVRDVKPDVRNFHRFDGNGAWHCPHCDGLESAGRRLAIIASGGSAAVAYAKEFLGWTNNIRVFIKPPGEVSEQDQQDASSLGIKVVTGETIVEISGGQGTKPKILLASSGKKYRADVLFYHLGYLPQVEIAESLGCKLDEGYVAVDIKQETSVPNVFAAGDVDSDRHYVVLAVAAGALAAISIYEKMLREGIRFTKSRKPTFAKPGARLLNQ